MLTWTKDKSKETAIARNKRKEYDQTYVGRIESVYIKGEKEFAFFKAGRGNHREVIWGCADLEEAIIVVTVRLRLDERNI